MKHISKILAVSLVIQLLSTQMGYAGKVSDFFTKSGWSKGMQNWGHSVYQNQFGAAGRFVKKSIIQDRMKNFPSNGPALAISTEEVIKVNNEAETKMFFDKLQKGGVNVTGNTGEFLSTLSAVLSGNGTAQKTQLISGNSTATLGGNSTAPKEFGPWSNVITMKETVTTRIQRKNMQMGHETIEQNIDLTPITLKQQ